MHSFTFFGDMVYLFLAEMGGSFEYNLVKGERRNGFSRGSGC